MGSDSEVILEEEKAIIFFDGVCNLCNGFVNFIIDRDKEKKYLFSSLQSPEAQTILSKYDFNPAYLSSVVLLQPNGKISFRSSAALRIFSNLGGLWPILSVLRLVPAFIRDFFYNIIARNRYRWFGKKDQCRIPTPELKQRFLDAY
ncbi:thiol-disulfide oxidoreductase DCC family protein [Fulvivirga ligni]|uniref:thiol-disulfide oxidoreductase DCC family protein n=1 Tax=Fulvivirga ligni TaxID=2904246 RepID=UPI001F272A2E|nr:thiol-disulfide oxidoreductase DCC family protein [Fulvivirga ligni]UII21078.1 thiol-disulfide oxidoreductase DCC family protein [Fulvivirga ligni]